MTNASTRKSAAAAKRSPLTLAGVGHGLQGWLIRNKFYIIAFFIPVRIGGKGHPIICPIEM